MPVIFLILLQELTELQKYKRLIFELYNPIYLSTLIVFLLILLLFISYKYIYNPLLRKHKNEIEDFEIKTAKLLALFSELDPNPIVRINTYGEIVGLNKVAKEKFSYIKLNSDKIDCILKEFDFNIEQSILDNRSFVISQNLDNKIYEINFHGISFLGMGQLYFLDVSAKKEYEEQMQIYQKLLRDSSAHLNDVLESERGRFSGLLHDSIGQNLLLIKMGMMNQKKQICKGLDESEFDNTVELLESTILEVKDIARNFKPLNIDELGLATVLKSMCVKVSKESGIKAKLQLPDSDIEINEELEICIYRVVQEALNNILRHSKANKFNVSLNIDDESAILIISDDGIGFKPTKLMNNKYISDGMGLLNMQERVERLNGTFHIDSSHNNGTIIMADFLIDTEDDGKQSNYKSSVS